jgi:serine/threonine-protein kinase
LTPSAIPFGDYRLLHRLAVGGMAEIFLAADLHAAPGQELVVIKRLREDLLANPDYCEMFIDEERVIRRLDHPGIVKVRDFGKVDGRYYMAIEYVWGESLSALTRLCALQGKQFPLSLALHTVARVAEALAHAHAQRDRQGRPAPVIHRDVTMGNVVVSYRGEVKILDFGIAKSSDRLSETRAGQVKGTPVYLAPEQIQLGDATPATDIYQLGVLLYHVTVGRPPLSWDSNADLMRQIVGRKLIPPTTWNPGYPPALEQVVLKAMAGDPDERFASASELALVLRHFVAARPSELQHRLSILVSELTGNRHAEQESFVAALLGNSARAGEAPVFSWAFEPRASLENELPVRVDRDELTGTALANRPVAEVVAEATQRESERPLPGPQLEPPLATGERTRPGAPLATEAALEVTERVERPASPPHPAPGAPDTPQPPPSPGPVRVAGDGSAGDGDDGDWVARTAPMPRFDPAAAASKPAPPAAPPDASAARPGEPAARHERRRKRAWAGELRPPVADSIHDAPTRIEQPADGEPPPGSRAATGAARTSSPRRRPR